MDNTVVNTINVNIPYNTNRLLNFIEVCRKPFYHFFYVDTFDSCVGSTFTYDVQNTNAISYQWQQNNVNVVGQTTGVLSLTNITTAQAGAYTCVMTNECGTTNTMALNLTVNCLGINNVANLDKAIKFYPNPATSILNIELPTNIDITITSCGIINLLGQTVYQSITNNKIDVSQLKQGIYVVSLQTNYGNWNGKFVKE
jgi:Secretion system C-terminal sorting domain